jgi:hypothetical protein
MDEDRLGPYKMHEIGLSGTELSCDTEAITITRELYRRRNHHDICGLFLK